MIKNKEPNFARCRRYSNDGIIGPPSIDDVDPTLPGGSLDNSGSSSGSSWWDKINWNSALNSLTGLFSNIFSPSWKYQNQTNSQLLQQEKRTNTILWVVVGIMVALGVVLLVRKR